MSKTKIDSDLREVVIEAARDRTRRIRCAGCGNVVVIGGFEIDHIKPEADGGATDAENLQVLCVRREGKRKFGCHVDKTAKEIRERAKAARGPRPIKASLVTGALGTVGLIYVYLDLFKGPQVSQRWLTTCIVLAIGSIGLVVTDNVVRARRTARPLEENPAAAPTPKNPADQAPLTGDALKHRIITTCKSVIKGGDVRVIMDKTADGRPMFTLHYPGSTFDDSPAGDGRALLVERLNTKLPGRWKPRWDSEHDIAVFEQRPDLPTKVPHPGFTPGRPWYILPIGHGAVFNLLVTSHILIVGATNNGKTSLLRAIIAATGDSARRGEVESVLLDPKQVEMIGFKDWPGVGKIITDLHEMWHFLIELREEMDERYRAYREDGVPLSSWPRKVIVIDEFAVMVDRLTEFWYETSEARYKRKPGQKLPPPLAALRTVITMARACGIHLVVSTQSPDAALFGGGAGQGSGVRQNLAGRAAVGRIDGIRAKQVFDDASIGRDLPTDIKGRATIQLEDGEPEEVQTYWVPNPADPDATNTPEDWAILERLRAA